MTTYGASTAAAAAAATTATAALTRAELGALGEEVAAAHLTGLGMVVLARNWRSSRGPVRGELDLLARDGDTLVVCEVKARRGVRAGEPLEAVHPRKQAKLRALVALFLHETGLRCPSVRFDAVAVAWPAPDPSLGAAGATQTAPQIVHLRGVC